MKYKILIVEDTEEEGLNVCEKLHNESYNVDLVINGEKALIKIKKELFDLILIDVGLPEGDDYGYFLCTMIKELPRYKDIPVIFLTGRTLPDDVQFGFDVGGVDYIKKPYSDLELLSRIKYHLKTRGYLKRLNSRISRLNKLYIRKESNYPFPKKREGVIIFTHGFGGTVKRWEKMIHVINDDLEIRFCYDIKKYSYPTTLFNFLLLKKFPDIKTISESFGSYITAQCSEYSKIIIVAHSMGGLISRKYLINEFNRNGNKNIKLALFATPNKGAELANFTKFIQIRNKVVWQMSKRSDFIEELNYEWNDLRIKDRYETMYVRADRDNIVSENPTELFNRVETETDKNHFSIGKPKNNDDTSYKLLKSFVLN